MNPEQKVVSYELAKRMRELGWKKETEKAWWIDEIDDKVSLIKAYGEQSSFLVPAPDFLEIWQELPETIDQEEWLETYKDNGLTVLRYAPSFIGNSISNTNPSEAAGEMWCWCVEKGYIHVNV